MNIILCAIARLENRYIREWVDYHLSIGFSHIYLYDNNRDGEERLIDVLPEARLLSVSSLKDVPIPNPECKITIIPLHHRSYVQCYAYQDCFDYASFDWIAFFDCDEFFTLSEQSGLKTVEDFIRIRAKDADAVLINWLIYGDNGLLSYSNDRIQNRFKKPMPHWFSLCNISGKSSENRHIKTMVRSGVLYLNNGPHVGKGEYSTCDAEGKKVENIAIQPTTTFKVAYLRHYVTKTISEWAEQKVRRQAADGPAVHYNLADFFLYNKPTFAKWRIYRKYCKLYGITDSHSASWWIKQIIKMWIITPFISLFKH